jgi:hypothetical protein
MAKSYDLRREVEVAKIQTLIDAVVALDGNTDEIEAKLQEMIVLLTSLDGKDYATETTLTAVENALLAIEIILNSIDGKVATETTLALIEAQTSQFTFTGGNLNVNATIDLGTSGTFGDNATVSTVALTDVSAIVLSANGDRKQFVVYNASNEFVYLFFGTPAVATKGITLAKKETYIEERYRGQVTAIMDAGKSGNIEVTDITL